MIIKIGKVKEQDQVNNHSAKILKNDKKNDSKNIKDSNKIKDRDSNNIKENKNNSSNENSNENNNNNDNKDEENKLCKNQLINWNKLVKLILNIMLGLLIYFLVGVELGYFNTIYCEPTDGEINNNVESNKDNKNASENKDVKSKDKDSYNISANVGKGMIKEAVEGALEGISNVVPAVIGGMVGGTLGATIMKASPGLPPVQKAMLGVTTAVFSAAGITTATGLSRAIVKNLTNNTEESNPSSVSKNTLSSGDSGKDGFIASVLDSGVELSPLQLILNYEIILGLLILVHMGLLFLIKLHKLYVPSVLNIISKLFSKKTVKKYEIFKDKIEKIGNSYLIILVIINIIFILFDLFLIIYANVELSNNIEDYIKVHLKMKNSIIMLLFVKSKFIVNKNKIEKNKYFNAWSKVESKKRNNMMEVLNVNVGTPTIVTT